MIFETERLQVRKLILSDLKPFHQMQSNPKVMQYVDGEVKTLSAHQEELAMLIKKYDSSKNDFWIYAIITKENNEFIGTVAFVKDGEEDEIGYRFLEQFWNRGYGSELCKGVIMYCKRIQIPKIIAYVVDENTASSRILKQHNFKMVRHFMNDEIQLAETKYELYL